MLSLCGQLKNSITPLGRLAWNDCRFLHVTAPLRAASNNNTGNRGPQSAKISSKHVTEKQLLERLAAKSKVGKPIIIEERETKNASQSKAKPVEDAEEEEKKDDENSDADLLDIADETSPVSETKAVKLESVMHKRVNHQLLDVAKKAVVQKIQNMGKWDDPEARLVVDSIHQETIKRVEHSVFRDLAKPTVTQEQKDRANKRAKAVHNTLDVASLRNQKYQVGDKQVSIEYTDEIALKKGTERETEAALAAHTLRARKEEPIIADNDSALISMILDRPSHAEKAIAEVKGEEVLEFLNEKEREEAEARRGKPVDVENITANQRQLAKRRGPAMKKNEHGEEELTLLYDEQIPIDRYVLRVQDPIKKLKYFPIYPQKVRTWVHYMKDCKGRYNKWGYWKQDPLLQEEEDELKEAIKANSRQKGDSGLAMMVEKRKQKVLPLDLEGHYRFGVQPDELLGIHPKVKEMLSFKHANNSEIHNFRAQQLVKRWQERPEDHGTPQVQIACMTNRINYLTDHLKSHRHDNQCKLQLRLLISRRHSMLKYIRKKNVPIYYQLVRELDIHDISF